VSIGADLERLATARQQLRRVLKEGPRTVAELSVRVSLEEREVLDHLSHIERESRHGERLRIEPAECVSCHFAFTKRRRLKRPSRCPVCKSERVSSPRFSTISKR
jgi:predicted Zn-ribbon and HTH transcriptional regulator